MYLIAALMYVISIIIGVFIGLVAMMSYEQSFDNNKPIPLRYISPIFTFHTLFLSAMCVNFILIGLSGFYPSEVGNFVDSILYYAVKVLTIQI